MTISFTFFSFVNNRMIKCYSHDCISTIEYQWYDYISIYSYFQIIMCHCPQLHKWQLAVALQFSAMQDKLFQNSNRLLTSISLILLYFTNTFNIFNLSSLLICFRFIATFSIIHWFKNNCLLQVNYIIHLPMLF